MREVKAPSRPGLERRVFLADSIEMGKAEQWQERIVATLSAAGSGDLVILNPRRDDWDDNWEQRADDPRFAEQVGWELDMLDAADVVVMYFAPGTKSPVSLLELGLCARSGKLKVCWSRRVLAPGERGDGVPEAPDTAVRDPGRPDRRPDLTTVPAAVQAAEGAGGRGGNR